MPFDLASVLSQAAGRDTGTDPAREKIELIPYQVIRSDPGNFYSTEGIDELATNIELIGLQQPIRIRRIGSPDDKMSFYRVVSGHRRLAAWHKLDLSYPDGEYRKIPAIIEPERSEPSALTELRLIYANSDTRKMTGRDLQRQAEKIKDLLQQLKDEGYEFKGRMRDHIAQLCGVSKSKLSRLNAIEKNLHAGIKGAYYNTGKIGESLAYEISGLPKEDQSEVCRKLGKGWNPTAAELKKWYCERAVNRNMQLVREKLKDDYDKLTAAIEGREDDDPEEDNEAPEDVPKMGTILKAEWQTGDPEDGRYMCLVDLGLVRMHEQKCDRRDGQWFAFGNLIDDTMFTVKAWWPLPPDPEFMTTRDLKDIGVEAEGET